MPVRVGNVQERADIIANLRTVTLSTDPTRRAMAARGADSTTPPR